MFTLPSKKKIKKSAAITSLLLASVSFTNTANATIVEFQTSHGNFQVNLFDQATPNTVSNFLNYIDEQHYTNSVVHRVVNDFVVQGGGYRFSGNLPLSEIAATRTVVNEPVYSNVSGTIAMAKLSGKPHSASDEWFLNLADNSDNLDAQNGGFTVFGQVIGDGMTVLNTIAGLERCNDTGNGGIPISDAQLCNAVPSIDDLVVVEQIIIIDSSEATANDLTPLLSKYPDSDSDGVNDVNDAFPSDATKYQAEAIITDGSGGSIAWLSIFMLALVTVRRRLLNKS